MHTQTRRFLSVSGSKPNYKVCHRLPSCLFFYNICILVVQLSLEDIDHSSEGPATFKLYPAVKQVLRVQ